MSVSDTITNYYIIVVRYAHKGEFYGFWENFEFRSWKKYN